MGRMWDTPDTASSLCKWNFNNNFVIVNVAEKTPPKKKRGRPAKAKAGMLAWYYIS